MPQITIAFVGQCHTSGYPGVPPEETFPQVCRRAVEAFRPGTTLDLVFAPYQHPSELPPSAEQVLRARPRVVVIEVIGWLAVKGGRAADLSRLPARVRTRYERMKHFRDVSQRLAAQVPDTLTRVPVNAHEILRPLLSRHPRPSVAEYESFVDRTVASIARVPGTHVVVQGPGAPNLELDVRGLPPDTEERYRAVEAMAKRVAAMRGALYVDRWDSVTSRFYLPGDIRPRTEGHSMWGHLLARELLRAGLV
jgi:hypothetical protein